MRTSLKYVLVTVLSLPTAAVFAFHVAEVLIAMVPDTPSWLPDLIFLASLFVAWGGLIYWTSRAPSIREAAARTFRALAVEAFLLPVLWIVGAVTSPPPEDTPIFPTWFWAIVFAIFGVAIGLLALLASWILSPRRAETHVLGRNHEAGRLAVEQPGG